MTRWITAVCVLHCSLQRYRYTGAVLAGWILFVIVQPVSAAGIQAGVIKAVNKDRAHRVLGSPQVGYWAVAGRSHQKAPRHVRLEGFADHCPAPARRRFAAWLSKKVERVRTATGSAYIFYTLSMIPGSGHLLVKFRDGTVYRYRCKDVVEIKLPQVPPLTLVGFLGQTADGALWFKAYKDEMARVDIRRIPWDRPVVIYRVHNGRVQLLHLPEAVKGSKKAVGPDTVPAAASVCDVGRVSRPGSRSRRMLLCIDRRMQVRHYPLTVPVSSESSGVYPLAAGLMVSFEATSGYAAGLEDKIFRALKYVCLKKHLSQCGIGDARVYRKPEESAYRDSFIAPTIAAYNGVVYFVSQRALYALDKNGVHRLLVFPRPVEKHKVTLAFAGPSTVLVTTPDFIYRVKR